MQALQAGGRWIKASRNFLRVAAGWAALACLPGWTRLDMPFSPAAAASLRFGIYASGILPARRRERRRQSMAER